MGEVADEVRKGGEVPVGALCLACNYDLRGLEGRRCPECGREFDPGDPWTMNMGRPLSEAGRRVLAPARWAKWVSYGIALVMTVWSTLLPGFGLLMSIGVLMGWAAVLAGMVVHGALKFSVRRIYRQERPRPDPDRLLLRRARVACLGAAVLVGLEVPFRAAFLVSRPFLERHVRHYHAEVPYDTPLPGFRVCGVLPVRIVWNSPRVVEVSILGGGYLYYSDEEGWPGSIWGAIGHPADYWYVDVDRPYYRIFYR